MSRAHQRVKAGRLHHSVPGHGHRAVGRPEVDADGSQVFMISNGVRIHVRKNSTMGSDFPPQLATNRNQAASRSCWPSFAIICHPCARRVL